jgi:hypothetical protein
MQDCRIRWGTVESVDTEHATIVSQRLMFDGGVLTLGDPLAETVRWSKDGTSLAPPPAVGETVAAHWDWICGHWPTPTVPHWPRRRRPHSTW